MMSNAAIAYGYAINTLENRLKAHICELCGATDGKFYEVHHINKLKNLKGKKKWELAMIAKKRKTLIVCRKCHRSVIHKKDFFERAVTEPYTLRGVRTVPGEVCADLPQQCGKAALSYSTTSS